MLSKLFTDNEIPSVYIPSVWKRIIKKFQLKINSSSDGYLFNQVSVATTYTVLISDSIILCDPSGGAFTITLPDATQTKNKVFFVKKTDSSVNAITVDTVSGNIDNAATDSISATLAAARYASDGTDYWKI